MAWGVDTRALETGVVFEGVKVQKAVGLVDAGTEAWALLQFDALYRWYTSRRHTPAFSRER